MKFRTDFVTNSSSSSFIIAINPRERSRSINKKLAKEVTSKYGKKLSLEEVIAFLRQHVFNPDSDYQEEYIQKGYIRTSGLKNIEEFVNSDLIIDKDFYLVQLDDHGETSVSDYRYLQKGDHLFYLCEH